MSISGPKRVCAGGIITALAFGLIQIAGAPVASAAAGSQYAGPVALGVDVLNARGQTRESAILAAEKKIGHKLAFTRDFLLWDSVFPTTYEKWLAQRGTVPMVSVKAELHNGAGVSWAKIAGAQPGSSLYKQMQSWGNRMRSFGHPVYFTFNHEPEAKTNLNRGSAGDYVAAWRKMYNIFHAEHATNVRYLWTMTSWAFKVPSSDRRYAAKWYPGDSYVNGLAADAYNWGKCTSSKGDWESLGTVINGFMHFGAQHPSKPMWLPEFGTVNGSSGQKAAWLRSVQATLKQSAYKQIAGISYYDELQPGVSCSWPIESSSAVSAIRTLANDSFFHATAMPSGGSGTPAKQAVRYVASSSTAAHATVEKVRVPSSVKTGNGLVLIATSSSVHALSAPTGWTRVASQASKSMYSTVWQRVAHSGDHGSSVSVKFGTYAKGTVELLAYSGTSKSHPVLSAYGMKSDSSHSTITAPTAAVGSYGRLLSYWATRSSAYTKISQPHSMTWRRSARGDGGGRITSIAADQAGAASGSRTAAVSPKPPHSLAWNIRLAAD